MFSFLRSFPKFIICFSITTTSFCAYSQPNYTIFAGNVQTNSGYKDDKGTVAMFNKPYDVAVDKDDNVYVADYENHVIRKITPDGTVSTLAGTPRSQGSENGKGSLASFYHPSSLVVDANGNVFVVDQGNDLIRKITPDGNVSTFAGGTYGSSIVNGQGTKAGFSGPNGIAIDANNNLYVTERFNAAVRKISSTGLVSTLGGNGYSVSKDGPFGVAQFDFPIGVAIDTLGNVIVSEYDSKKIRRITPDGTVTSFAGTGVSGKVDSTYLFSSFNCPADLFTGNDGNIYVVDICNGNIRILNRRLRVRTILVKNWFDNKIISQYGLPQGAAMDKSGNIYIADSGNNRIMKISTNATGIEEDNSENFRFSIFPNPANSVLSIQLGSQSLSNISCNIYTIQGTLVSTNQMSIQDLNLDLNIANLDAGTYIIELSNNSTTRKSLFVKK